MFSDLEQTFRWFGPNDPVTLPAIRQTGAVGIVTALHHIPCGEVWSLDEIKQRDITIKEAGLRWSVVESVNIHESIKTGGTQRDGYIDKYIATLKNLSESDVKTVCYNFMPVLDWTRTDLDYRLPNNASALRYDAIAVAAFDLYILQRENASNDLTIAQQQRAKLFFDRLSPAEREQLTHTIMAGLPGTGQVYSMVEFKQQLKRYGDVNAETLQANLAYFLRAVIPVAEELGIKMCIHPDDPPFPILGLPRIVSTEKDFADVINACPSVSNGLTFCTGSLGSRGDNDLPGMISRLGAHIHFIHLRNVQRESDGSFHEADHLSGSNDMYAIMKSVILEQKKRSESSRRDIAIPMRPDHGHRLLDDFNYSTYPGYSIIGRLKGLAELRGLELGIKRSIV